MATSLIRYTNKYAFQIEHDNVDLSTDEIVVKDYAFADPTMVYCVLDERNHYAYKHELVSKDISSGDYTHFLMTCYTPTRFYITDEEKAKLLSEGVCTATDGHGSLAKVFVGLKIKSFLEEQGAKSLKWCCKDIKKRRKQHDEKQSEINKLLSIGASVDNKEESSEDTLVDEIKWFLDNRKEIKAKYKN